MRAWLCRQPGDYSDLELTDLPEPVPGPDELCIQTQAVSVGFPEMLMTQGLYQLKPEPPFVPGMEFAGRVCAVGSAVDTFQVDDLVMGTVRFGAYAEQIVTKPDLCLRIPAGFDVGTAAAFLIAYKTAYVGLVERGRLRAGDKVLVHGAAGGVGLAAVDLANALGAEVYASASSADKRKIVAEHGASFTFDAAAQNFNELVKAQNHGGGVDMVFDPVGGDVFDESLRCLAPLGRLLVIGFASGRIPTLPVNYALIKQLEIIGVRAGEYGRLDAAADARVNEALLNLAGSGRLQPHVHARLPFAALKDAFDQLSGRTVVGRIVLDVYED